MKTGMNRDEILENVVAVIKEVMFVKSSVTEETDLQKDLDVDSLDAAEIVMEIETFFGIEISDVDAEKIKTVGDVADLVVKLKE